MGLFDTIFNWMNCPYCGKYSEIELQTKDLRQLMHTYHTVELNSKKTYYFIKKEYRLPKEFWRLKYINIIGDCHEIKCQFDADRRDLIQQNSPSGFGRLFTGRLKIKDGYLLNKVYDLKLDGYTEKKLEQYKEKCNDKKYLQKLLKKYKHEPIALRYWNFLR